MEQLKAMKEQLTACVQAQIGDLKSANAEELGEAVDMIKDLSEAIYYCTITKAMEDSDKEKEMMRYVKPIYYYNEMGGNKPRYYNGSSSYAMSGRGGNQSGSRRNYSDGRMYYDGEMMEHYPRYMEDSYPMEIRDYREGRSPVSRRMYMESKELHHDKAKQMKELEQYMKELSEDITEMIDDATPDEKEILSQKLTTLAEKIR